MLSEADGEKYLIEGAEARENDGVKDERAWKKEMLDGRSTPAFCDAPHARWEMGTKKRQGI